MPKSKRKPETSLSVPARRGRTSSEELSKGLPDAPKKALKKERVEKKSESKEKKSKVPAATSVCKEETKKEAMKKRPTSVKVVQTVDTFSGAELLKAAREEFEDSDKKVSLCQIIIQKVLSYPVIVRNYDAIFRDQQEFLTLVFLQKMNDGDDNWKKKTSGGWEAGTVDDDIKEEQAAALEKNKKNHPAPCTVHESKRTATGTTLKPHSQSTC